MAKEKGDTERTQVAPDISARVFKSCLKRFSFCEVWGNISGDKRLKGRRHVFYLGSTFFKDLARSCSSTIPTGEFFLFRQGAVGPDTCTNFPILGDEGDMSFQDRAVGGY